MVPFKLTSCETATTLFDVHSSTSFPYVLCNSVVTSETRDSNSFPIELHISRAVYAHIVPSGANICTLVAPKGP